MVKVSVLLPVYNNKEDVLNAIQSVIDQTYKDWELIIIDDASTDGTWEVLNDFYNQSPYKAKIKLLRNEKNSGVYISLNEGLLKANGEYISRVDSDDRLDPRMLSINVQILDKFPQFVVCQSYAKRENEQKRYGEVTMFYRKSIIKEIGYYDSVRFGADAEFFGRVYRVYSQMRMAKHPEILYYAKRRKDSLTTSPQTGINAKSKNGKFIRFEYEANFRAWFRKVGRPYMPYPLLERPFPVNDIMKPSSLGCLTAFGEQAHK